LCFGLIEEATGQRSKVSFRRAHELVRRDHNVSVTARTRGVRAENTRGQAQQRYHE